MLYAKSVSAASVGATAGTYDSIGSVTLRSDAKYVYGFLVSAALATNTAAEAYSGILKFNSSDMGIGDQLFLCPPVLGGGPATNIGYSANKTEFIPFFKAVGGKEVLNFLYSSNLPDPTGAASVTVAVVYEGGKGEFSGLPIPSDVLKTYPEMSPISAGGQAMSLAAVNLVSTSIGTVTIPAWASEIVGIRSEINPNLMTAGEERVGYIELQSTIADIAPQEWPFGSAINAPLGTPVGQGVTQSEGYKMCCYIPKAKQNETITAICHLNVAITTGDSVSVGLYYR